MFKKGFKSYLVDIELGILCSVGDWKKQDSDIAALPLLPIKNSRRAVMIDLGLVRNSFRFVRNYSHIIKSESTLAGFIYKDLKKLHLKRRIDLENLQLWPLINFSDDGVPLRHMKASNLLNNNEFLGEELERVSFQMLRPGLHFPYGIHTTIMQQPEIVALIEGVDFVYPVPQFIGDMGLIVSGIHNNLDKRDFDSFRSSDMPVLWKGQRCILCQSAKFIVRHIIGTSRIVKCTQCGLEFDNPQAIINPKQLDKYSSRYDRLRGGMSSLKRADQTASVFMVDINLLCPALNKQRLLDVGCASGEFLHVLNSKYKWPATNLRGVEPSEISASDANKKYKINVQNCPAESLVIDHNSFDLITILNSIEHFSDPRLVLRQLRNIIRPHGMLFIGTVPNVNSLPSLLFPEGFIAKNMPDGQHHYQFCPETLSQLCKLEGYSVISLLGRRRDIVGNNAEMVAKWLAYSCGVPVNKLINPKKLLQEFEKRVHFGQELALRKGEKYLYKINDYDFESFEASISFWRREIWSSPYLSDAFDIWLCPQS